MHVYKFRDCLLNTLERSVIRDNSHLELTTKTFDVLQYLIENAGKVVTKDEILGTVWNGNFVEESNLPVHISKLRRLLDESKDRRFIETVQGVGYRFVSPLKLTSESEWKTAHDTSRAPQRRAEINPQSIAVLPLENESRDPNIDYLVAGLTESLINGLSHTPGLRVIARNTVFRYRNSSIDVGELGSALQVQKLLSGRVRLSGETISISVELIEAADNRHIWGERYDVPFSKIVEVERSIVEEIQKIVTTTIIEPSSLSVQTAANAESYKYYLMGEYVFQKRLAPEVYKAIDYFRKSINYCPTNVHSYVAIVNAYHYLFVLDRVSYAETLTSISPVLAVLSKLNPAIDVVQLMHAKLGLHLDWKVDTAEKRVKEALRLNPNLVEAHALYGQILALLGRKSDVECQAQNILDLDPVSPVSQRQVGRLYYHMEQYETAISYLNNALELEPSDFETLILLGAVLAELGEYDQALDLVKKSYGCQKNIETLGVIGYVEALAGKRQKAIEIINSISSDIETQHSHAMNLAIIYLAIGEKEKTYQFLEQALQEHSLEIYALCIDPRFKSIRTDSRFRNLIYRVKHARRSDLWKNP
jgi:TolB-like protein